MLQKFSEPVSVSLVFDHTQRHVYPHGVVWNGRKYSIIKVGLHHAYRVGKTLYHVFSVESETLFFRLVLDTETLHWTLEEVSDGELS